MTLLTLTCGLLLIGAGVFVVLWVLVSTQAAVLVAIIVGTTAVALLGLEQYQRAARNDR